jgi:hypothetical protein
MPTKSISAIGAIQTLIFFLAGTILFGAFVRIPVAALDTRTLIYLLIGLSAVPFLGRDLRLRYLTFWILMGGSGGLLLLLLSRTQQYLGSSSFDHYGNHTLVIAASFYSGLLAVGLLLFRHIRSRRATSS